jgi:hypothetical protein
MVPRTPANPELGNAIYLTEFISELSFFSSGTANVKCDACIGSSKFGRNGIHFVIFKLHPECRSEAGLRLLILTHWLLLIFLS